MKQTKKSVAGTSFHDTVIWTTVKGLKQILGEPTFNQNTGEDKVNYEWNMETSEGDVFTIYDWKEYQVISEDWAYCFHVGGKTKVITEKAKEAIIDQMEKYLTESNFYVGGLTSDGIAYNYNKILAQVTNVRES